MMVLKVALDASLNERLAGEGEALETGHPNIVRVAAHAHRQWSHRAAHDAGEKTLADRIREEARLSPICCNVSGRTDPGGRLPSISRRGTTATSSPITSACRRSAPGQAATGAVRFLAHPHVENTTARIPI